ncbi:MAG: hydrogenase maturation peptidase HycI [Candidatus Verstraetearchaeota archaeon]|jgi:hydrogenase 3 maturation protease|nr:hydrogenase maturation peptidase HycI [Candidatus Verstraetearchaeota archaeon]
MTVKEDLLVFLKDAKKLLFVGIGNKLRKDDGAGSIIISRLKRRGIKSVIDCEIMPENFIGKIKRINPTHIIFFDAIDMGEKPGTYRVISENELCERFISTHRLPIKILFKILKEEIPNVKILLIGIQPKNIEFGKGLSKSVNKGINSLIEEIIEVIKCEQLNGKMMEFI